MDPRPRERDALSDHPPGPPDQHPAASISVAMSASLKAIASWRAIGLPKAWRSTE